MGDACGVRPWRPRVTCFVTVFLRQREDQVKSNHLKGTRFAASATHLAAECQKSLQSRQQAFDLAAAEGAVNTKGQDKRSADQTEPGFIDDARFDTNLCLASATNVDK